MDKHTFFICASEKEYFKVVDEARSRDILKAGAAFTIVVCKGTKDQVMAKGMPSDVTHFDGDVPPEVIQALPDEFIRKNVDRVSKLYGSAGPGTALFQKYSLRFRRGEKKAAV